MPERMSNFSEAGKITGRKPLSLPEKSNFSQTCNLLSQYLKEKGSFGDLSLGMTYILGEKAENSELVQITEKMNLVQNTKISGDISVFSDGSSGGAAASCKVKSMDLFPQDTGFSPTPSMEDVPNKACFSEIKAVKEPETAQMMTIFYSGKVLVFDKFSPNKVKEIMDMASNLTSQQSTNGSPASTTDNDQELINSSGGLNASSSNLPSVSGINSTQERFVQAKLAGNLPIARKASLHRFLEKRKDRISSTRAPYRVNTSSTAEAPTNQEESKMWLGLASQSSKPFEL